MKYVMIAAFAATALSATAANAGTLNAEVRLGDVRGGQAPDSTEYRVQWDAPIAYGFQYGAELQVKQGNNEGPINSLVSAKLGYELPTVLGFHALAYGEVGKNLKQGDNYEFWGAGAKVKRQVYGPVSVNAGYRHREAFTGTGRLTENRLNAGLGFALSDNNTVGVTYYRTTGTARTDQVGLGLTHTF